MGRRKENKENRMRMWVFTIAMLLGLASWETSLLQAVEAEDGTVTSMEDGYPPPKP
jgi:hypothetical protein